MWCVCVINHNCILRLCTNIIASFAQHWPPCCMFNSVFFYPCKLIENIYWIKYHGLHLHLKFEVTNDPPYQSSNSGWYHVFNDCAQIESWGVRKLWSADVQHQSSTVFIGKTLNDFVENWAFVHQRWTWHPQSECTLISRFTSPKYELATSITNGLWGFNNRLIRIHCVLSSASIY